jgi:hypothetical protein
MIDLTVCLLNWKRKENLDRILDLLHGNVKVFLWDNSGDLTKDPRTDWQITSSINQKCHPRWWMLQQAKTKYVCSMDDDLILKDIEIFNHLIEFLEKNPECLGVGGFGKIINHYLPYKNWGQVNNVKQDTYVDILLGRLILTKTQNIKDIVINESEDDIQLCSIISKKQRQKFIVPALLKDNIMELSDDFALWRHEGHFQRREKAIEKYWFLDNRNQIGCLLNNEITGCELGVFEGDYSKTLIETRKFKKLYLVDTFEGIIHGTKEKIYDDGSVLFDQVKNRFAEEKEVCVVKQDAVSFLESMQDSSLDFVYIDTLHTYDQTIKELESARRAVKNKGLICGHDYRMERFPGICQAVEEFCLKHNLIFKLTQKDAYKSFFIVNHKK